MSNIGVATPVAAAAGVVGVTALAIGGCIAGVIAAAAWVCQETEEDRKVLDEFRKQKRRELLENPLHGSYFTNIREAWPQVKAETLHLTSPETLITSATKLGYSLVPQAGINVSPAQMSQVFMAKPTGERIALSYTQDNRILVTTAGEDARIHNLVRQHTIDRAISCLQKVNGMEVDARVLSNGTVSIEAQGKVDRGKGDRTKVKAHVHKDGTIAIDVDDPQHERCHKIIDDIAEAIGGKITSVEKKKLSFSLPGEPTKTKVKI